MNLSTTYTTGLVLGGGFIKGFAHLGVFQALLEHGIRPDLISGTSAGALAGAFLADGQHPGEILEHFRGKRFSDLTDLALRRRGLMDLEELTDFIRAHMRARTFQELSIPLVITVTDLDSGLARHIRTGEVAPWVAASCCIPVLFCPIVIDGTTYVDGGVRMDLPVGPIRSQAGRVIAVDLSSCHSPLGAQAGMAGIALRCFELMHDALSIPQRQMADLLIAPRGLEAFSNRDLEKSGEIYGIGYRAAREALELGWMTPTLKEHNQESL